MADAPKILGTDTLRQMYPKVNSAIDNANEALTTAKESDSKSTNAVSTANTAETKADSVQAQFDTIIIESGTSDAEVLQARTDAKAITFTTLQKRLNDRDEKMSDIVYNVKSFGAVGDGITDDTSKIQEAYNQLSGGQTLFIPKGNFLISNLVFDKDDIFFECQGTLVQKTITTGAAVTVGLASKDTYRTQGNLKVRKQTRDWTQNNIGVKLLNVNEAEIILDVREFTTNLLLEGDNKGTCYNNIYPKILRNGKDNIKFAVVGPGWVNANKFFGGRLQWISGIADKDRRQVNIPTNTMNDNRFYGTSLESLDGGTLIYCNGQYNKFDSVRLESPDPTSTIVNFGAQSLYNKVEDPYFHGDLFNDSRYIDSGSRNQLELRDTKVWKDTQIRPHNIRIRGSKNGNSNWGIDGLVDVGSTSSNSDKLWSGKDTTGTETSHIDGNGAFYSKRKIKTDESLEAKPISDSSEALSVYASDGTTKRFGVRGDGFLQGQAKASAAYSSNWLIPWAVVNSVPVTGVAAVGVGVFNTSDNKLYIHTGGGVWRSVTFT